MAFDIYAGTFVRFYTRDWKNVVQRQAELDGTRYQMIYAGGDQGAPPAEDIRMAVDAWKQGINSALAPHGLGPIDWSEADGQPYFTDRPSWEGYFALQQWAAHLERPDVPVPFSLPEDPFEGTALAAVLEDDSKLHFRSIIQGGAWLPGDFDFLFKFPALTEGETMIGSTGRLLHELRELREKPLAWEKLQTAPSGKSGEAIPFQEIAEWSLSAFENVVAQGHSARVPFMLSF